MAPKLPDSPPSQELSFCLGCDLSEIREVTREVAGRLALLGYGPADVTRVELILSETIANAVIHGNLRVNVPWQPGFSREAVERGMEEGLRDARYASRKVHVRVWIGPESCTCQVEDEGPGFDRDTLPDPRSPGNVGLEHGRGVFLLRAYVDEVRWNEAGNCITVVLYRLEPEIEALLQRLGNPCPFLQAPRRLDHEGATMLAHRVRLQVACPRRAVIVDLSKVSFADPTSARSLLHIHKEATEQGGTVVFCCPSEVMREMIRLLHLLEVLHLEDSLEEAVRRTSALSSAPPRPTPVAKSGQ